MPPVFNASDDSQAIWAEKVLNDQREELNKLLDTHHALLLAALRASPINSARNSPNSQMLMPDGLPVPLELVPLAIESDVESSPAAARPQLYGLRGMDAEEQAIGEVIERRAKEAGKAKQKSSNSWAGRVQGKCQTADSVVKALNRQVKKESNLPHPHSIDDLPLGHRLTTIVNGWLFEMVFAIFIMLNTISMCVESEYRGQERGHVHLGVEGLPLMSAGMNDTFKVIEFSFAILFSLEVLMKMIVLNTTFFSYGWNVFDFTTILFGWINYTFSDIDVGFPPMALRLIRLVRLLRLVRSLIAFEIFDNLHLMVQAIKASAPILVWVVALIVPVLAASALGLSLMLIDYLEDESEDMNERLEVYDYFGTFNRAMITMFEVTFSNYVPVSRMLSKQVGGGFAVFFICYKMIVGLAVLRVIYGVFMHMTFHCANSDDEAQMTKKHRELKKYAEKMHLLFLEMDASGDGFLSRDEFCKLASLPSVQTFLAASDLEIRDAELIFELLADQNYQISAKNMVYGFSWLQGNARSVDLVALIGLVKKCIEKLDGIQATEDKLLVSQRSVERTSYRQVSNSPNLGPTSPSLGNAFPSLVSALNNNHEQPTKDIALTTPWTRSEQPVTPPERPPGQVRI